MLTSFERDMISIIRAAIVGGEPRISENFDFDLAHNFAQKMQIVPLACCGIEKIPNAFLDTGSKKFLKSTISYSFFCESQDKEIESVLKEFDKNGIEYVETASLDGAMPELDILYMTRVQRERFFNEQEYIRLKDSYILTPEKLDNAKSDLAILHPLPRVNEISVAIDKDPRACYFRQVLNGKYIRMALIKFLLEVAR